MTDLRNSLEGGTAGTPVSTGNSGGASGDAFTAVAIDSVFEYDNSRAAHGTQSAHVSGTSATNYGQWPVSGAVGWFRWCLHADAAPSGNTNIFRVVGASNLIMCTLRINSTGKLAFLYATGSLGGTTTANVSFTAPVRIEVMVDCTSSTTGAVEVRLYNSMDSTTPTETISTSGRNLGATALAGARFGFVANSTWEMWLDDLAYSDVGWIGPVSSGSTPIAGSDSSTLTESSSLTTLPAGTLVNTTTFTGTDGAAWPAPWTAGVSGALNGTKSIVGNAGRMKLGTDAGSYVGADRSSARPDITTPTDAVWKTRFRFVNSAAGGVDTTQDNCFPALFVRSVNNMDTQQGYAVSLSPFGTGWTVDQITAFGGTGTAQLSSGADAYAVNTWYWCIFGVVGSSLKLQIWQDGTTQPSAWTWEGTDSTWSSGACGLTIGDADVVGAVFDWDDTTLYSVFPSLPAGSTPITATDTATQTEGSTALAASSSLTDSSSLTEASQLLQSLALAGVDSAALAEAPAGLLAVLARVDTSTLTEAAALVVTVAGADALTATDSSTLLAALDLTDVLTLTEGASASSATLAAVDAWSLADSSTLNAGGTLAASDSSTLGESAAAAATITGADTSTLAESSALLVVLAGVDSAALAEASALNAGGTLTAVDAWSLGEASTVTAAAAGSDSSTLAEASALLVILASSDTASQTEATTSSTVAATAADSWSLVEASTLNAGGDLSASDAGALTEAAASTAIVVGVDSSAMTEASALLVILDRSDTLALTEGTSTGSATLAAADAWSVGEASTLTAGGGLTAADAWSLDEASAITAALAAADGALLAEQTAGLVVTLTRADAAALTEASALLSTSTLTGSDVAALIEASQLLIVDGEITTRGQLLAGIGAAPALIGAVGPRSSMTAAIGPNPSTLNGG